MNPAGTPGNTTADTAAGPHTAALHTAAPPGLSPPHTPCTDLAIDFAPMTQEALQLVAEVEKTAYSHPWTLRHFQDSLQTGYLMQMLVAQPSPAQTRQLPWLGSPTLPDGRHLLGYVLAMQGVDEVHLLNITTAPAHQRRGWARLMMDALAHWARQQQAQWLWLEVRASNLPARALYASLGYRPMGLRKGYYPNGHLAREDALVMALDLRHPSARAAPHELT